MVPKELVNIDLMYGGGPTKTIVTGNKSYGDGIKTMRTATFSKYCILEKNRKLILARCYDQCDKKRDR